MSDKQKKEGNLYDKIFKENAESIFMPLVEQQLNIKIKHYRPLKEKMQTTVEREMDFFYEVTTDDDKFFILHLEFQSEDDNEMVYRTGEYHGMALRRKKMPIKHVVIYLSASKPKMKTALNEDEIYKGFELINIHEFNTDQLLTSQVPEVVLLAVLSDYPKERAEAVLRLVVRQLKTVSKNKSELSKYLKQLIILSRLRKLENITAKIVHNMPITYNVETDYLYQQGIEKGIEKETEKRVEDLLLSKLLSPEQIATTFKISLQYVLQIKQRLEAK